MEANPPPYNPHIASYLTEPTAPAEAQVYPNPMTIDQSSNSPTSPGCLDDYSPEHQNGFFDAFEDRPPDYDSVARSSPETILPVSSRDTPCMPQEVRPLRCKSGTVCIAVGDCTDLDQIRTWKLQYIEVRDCNIYVSPNKDKRCVKGTISLKNRYVSMPGKRLIAIQGGHNTLLIKSSSEVLAHQWFMTLSQYCYVAPMMEGYADKLSRGKSQFEERFLRLSSDGVLSWYRNDNDDSEPRGSIQLRGERCDIDTSNSRIVIIFVEPKPYQFRFYSTREAQLWLAAFQWHYGRKKLRKAAVPLRNKVK